MMRAAGISAALLTREAIAEAAGILLRQLERSFWSRLGRGVHEHYMALRIGRARQLLRETSLSILEISVATGFGSASQFSRVFKQAMDMTPRQARLSLG